MTTHRRQRVLDAIVARFRRDRSGPAPRCFFAPGRINLVGAHLDYSGGDVLPMAVHRRGYAGIRLRDDGRVHLCSLDQEPPVALDADAVPPRADPQHGWANYPLGVWHGFRSRTGHARGIDVVFGGDLPMASG